MPRNKPRPQPVSSPTHPAQHPTVSARWLLTAIAIVIPAAAFCAWAVLCLLFWQGSWQLLYHPASAVTRTPATSGIPFNPVAFAPNETGAPQLQGWWIPALASPRYTAIYLHGANGNLSDALDSLACLHTANVNVFAFDYRGYGQSQFVHPSEARWRQDAESALQYLTGTRHIDPGTIVLDGSALGANLALQVAAAHPELAGVILENPIDSPVNVIFNDPRAHLVPARLIVSDRFDLVAPARMLQIPSLLLLTSTDQIVGGASVSVSMRELVLRSSRVKTIPRDAGDGDLQYILARWLNNLNEHR